MLLFMRYYKKETSREELLVYKQRQEGMKVVQQLDAGWARMTKKGSLPSLTFQVVSTEPPFM